MGYYLNHKKLPAVGKAAALMQHFAAERLIHRDVPKSLEDFEAFEKGIVVVVENGPFDAAGVAYTFEELQSWMRDVLTGTRPFAVLSMDKATIEDILGLAPWE